MTFNDKRLIEVAFPLEAGFSRLGTREEHAARSHIHAAHLAGEETAGRVPGRSYRDATPRPR